jgi:DNA repair exonuclease SbcCD nuclease subunit
MRLLALADTHLGFKKGRTAEARRTIFNGMFNTFEHALKIAKSERVDAVLHAGDLFNRSKPTRKVISRTYKLIDKLLKDDIGFFIVPGNHERAKLPLSLLNHIYDKIHLFTTLSRKEVGDIVVFGFPYDSKYPKTTLKKIGKTAGNLGKRSVIILCHQLWKDATFGPHRFRFSKGHDVLHTSILPEQVKMVISGHIHRAQVLQRGKVVYPGSLERTSFIESIEPKGYVIIDLESEIYNLEFRELPSIPMKVIEIDISRKNLDFPSLKEKLSSINGRILLRFTGHPLNQEEISKLYETLPANEWPWLQFAPTLVGKKLQPLYKQKVPFKFSLK